MDSPVLPFVAIIASLALFVYWLWSEVRSLRLRKISAWAFEEAMPARAGVIAYLISVVFLMTTNPGWFYVPPNLPAGAGSFLSLPAAFTLSAIIGWAATIILLWRQLSR
jgi:hypothetical protein